MKNARFSKKMSTNRQDRVTSSAFSRRQVLDVHDVSSIYRVPLLLEDQKVAQFLINRLKIHVPAGTKSRKAVSKWRELADRYADGLVKNIPEVEKLQIFFHGI